VLHLVLQPVLHLVLQPVLHFVLQPVLHFVLQPVLQLLLYPAEIPDVANNTTHNDFNNADFILTPLKINK
jgi:hypothetical protein